MKAYFLIGIGAGSGIGKKWTNSATLVTSDYYRTTIDHIVTSNIADCLRRK